MNATTPTYPTLTSSASIALYRAMQRVQDRWGAFLSAPGIWSDREPVYQAYEQAKDAETAAAEALARDVLAHYGDDVPLGTRIGYVIDVLVLVTSWNADEAESIAWHVSGETPFESSPAPAS